MEISGAKIIVTGGSDGYGKGIAKMLKAAGAQVWITGRNEAKLQAAASELGVDYLVADVTKPEDWDRVFAATGCPDVLVNNAGAGGKIAPVAEQSDEDIIDGRIGSCEKFSRVGEAERGDKEVQDRCGKADAHHNEQVAYRFLDQGHVAGAQTKSDSEDRSHERRYEHCSDDDRNGIDVQSD